MENQVFAENTSKNFQNVLKLKKNLLLDIPD
jgi:predicted protein tyrosine phosphatase